MDALGRHILVEYFDCNHELMNDHDKVKELMNAAAIESGATIVDSVFHMFNPHGVSGVVVIAESHLAIHTWPEYNYAAVDLFTCGSSVDPWLAFKFLEKEFSAQRSVTHEHQRGKLDLIDKSLKHKAGPVHKPAALFEQISESL